MLESSYRKRFPCGQTNTRGWSFANELGMTCGPWQINHEIYLLPLPKKKKKRKKRGKNHYPLSFLLSLPLHPPISQPFLLSFYSWFPQNWVKSNPLVLTLEWIINSFADRTKRYTHYRIGGFCPFYCQIQLEICLIVLFTIVHMMAINHFYFLEFGKL